MRGWRRRNCARCRLRSRLSFAGGGSGIGGALFLALQREDLSVANLISSGLFADGSAAVIVAGAEFESSGSEISGPKILATRSVFYPGTEEMMGWNISEKGGGAADHNASHHDPNVLSGWGSISFWQSVVTGISIQEIQLGKRRIRS
jgi:hypothetical protein